MTDPTPPTRPPRVKPRIKVAPKIRQVFWCEFWIDAHLPEMWKVRPVVVVSYKNSLFGPCLVIPLSTVPHDDTDVWAYKISVQIDGVTSWAICNQPSTVAPSRLRQFNSGIPVLPKDDFNQILEKLMKWLPKPFELEK